MKSYRLLISIALIAVFSVFGCTGSEDNKSLLEQNKALETELIKAKKIASDRGEILQEVLLTLETVQSEGHLKGFQVEELTEMLDQMQEVASSNSKQITNLKGKVVAAEKKAAREKAIHDQLVRELKGLVEAGQAEILRLSGKTRIRLAENVLFGSGDAKLMRSGEEALKKIGEQLNQIKDRRILIEGHTDSVPIGKSLKSTYASNLELSAARAVSVHRFLRSTAKLPEKHLTLVALGPYQPIASNNTDAGRKKNRRVVLVLEPLSAE